MTRADPVHIDTTGPSDPVRVVGGSAVIELDNNPAHFLNGQGAFTAPAGGGDSTTKGLFSARPAAGNDGNLFFPTDAYTVDRDTGAAWNPWGPLFSLTPPVLTDFSWVNQGSATAVQEKNGIWLRDNSGGWNWRILKKAAPATPYTITMGLLPMLPHTQYPAVGLAFRASGSGAFHILLLMNNLGEQEFYSAKYTNPTTLSGNYAQGKVHGFFYGPLPFLRIADNGVNRICSFSNDGQHFTPFHTVARTDFLTADEIGFALNPGGNQETGMNLLHWVQS